MSFESHVPGSGIERKMWDCESDSFGFAQTTAKISLKELLPEKVRIEGYSFIGQPIVVLVLPARASAITQPQSTGIQFTGTMGFWQITAFFFSLSSP
jgi:hypothetical protein